MNAIIFSMLVLILVFLVFIVVDRRKDNKALYDAIELLTSKQAKSVKDYVEHVGKTNNDSMVESMEATKNFLNKEIQGNRDRTYMAERKIVETIEKQVQSVDQNNCDVLVNMMHKLIDANNKIYAELQKINKPKTTNKTTDKATVNFKKDTANKKQKVETENEAKNS